MNKTYSVKNRKLTKVLCLTVLLVLMTALLCACGKLDAGVPNGTVGLVMEDITDSWTVVHAIDKDSQLDKAEISYIYFEDDVKVTTRSISVVYQYDRASGIWTVVKEGLWESDTDYTRGCDLAAGLIESGEYNEAYLVLKRLPMDYNNVRELFYNTASGLMADGNYDDAIVVFSEIISYKDSTEQIKECNYLKAAELMANCRYDDAIEVYNQIYTYKDSSTQIKVCKYLKAAELMGEGSYEDAIEIFTEIIDYRDSAEQIKACETAILDDKYNAAVELMDAGRYEEAIDAFTELKWFKDSKLQIEECKYRHAVELMDAGRYEEAIDAFAELNWYKDNRLRIEECNYRRACELRDDGAYAKAIAAFAELNDYKDSSEQMTAIIDNIYETATALMKEGKYKEAIEFFIEIYDYKDSADQINACETEIFMSANVGDVICFGTYEQDNNLENGSEPIEWIVLDRQGDSILVISKYALDCVQYNTERTDVTWETCTLRAWMNGTFLNAAFSPAEQAMIAVTTVSADKNPKYSTDPGNDTTDKVFLLSITEAKKYLNPDSTLPCQPTEYAVANGAYVFNSGNSGWWLRSPAKDLVAAQPVRDNSIDGAGLYVDGTGAAVRPAMWINVG